MFLIMIEQLQSIHIKLAPSRLPDTTKTTEQIRQLVDECWERNSRFAPEGVYFPRPRVSHKVKDK